MVFAGMTIVLFGVIWIGVGALPVRISKPDADRALVRGAVLLPAGMALMVGGQGDTPGGIPRVVLQVIVVLSALFAAWVVYRMSEEVEVAPRRRVAELEPTVRVPAWVPHGQFVQRLIGSRF